MVEPRPPKWKDCKEIYQLFDEIVEALNDKGQREIKKVRGKEVPEHNYPLMKKLALKIFTSINELYNNPDVLTKNASRKSVIDLMKREESVYKILPVFLMPFIIYYDNHIMVIVIYQGFLIPE